MNLIIDIGNSRIKIAVFNNDELIDFRQITKKELLRESILSTLDQYTPVKKAIVSNVAGLPFDMNFLSEKLELHIFSEKLKLPIVNNYHTPETLGKDRLAAAVGAFTLFPDQNSLIIDAGTCITIDLLDEHNIYEGGAIMLGFHKKAEALHTFTGKLPLITLNFSEKADVLGKSTNESISSGILNGTLFEVEGFIKYYKQFYKNLNIIITGGDSNYFEKNLNLTKFVSPNLVLIGLNKILNFNAK